MVIIMGQGIEVSHSSCITYVIEVVDEKDERAYMAPHDTVAITPLKSSLEPSPFPNACLPLLSAGSHGLDLLFQIRQIVCFMLVIIVHFVHGTVIGGIICSVRKGKEGDQLDLLL